MQQSKQNHRTRGQQRDPSKIKPKFKEQREEEIKLNPLRPLNQKQAQYIKLLQEKPVVVATGFAGTSKSYIPTVMAGDAYKLGTINRIIVTRPAVSSSKSVGFTSGDFSTKMTMWLGGVVPILKERLGPMFDIALEKGDIEFMPLEVVKSISVSNAFFLVEEASDLTKDEVIKLITRMGKDSTLVLAGDIRQAELKGESGLVWLANFIQRHDMNDVFGFIDFNETNDIVRSDAVRKFIVNLVRDEKKGIN